jgi:trehalose 6-phosphate phosphatase
VIHALSEAGLRALRDAASRTLLYAFDFDGTLAPISSDRHAVTLAPGVAEWLRELTKRVPCAIVSGRALADVSLRTNGIVPHVIGNHGIESPLTSRSTLTEAERICADWKRELESTLAPMILLGAEIEDKRYSLTVHVRLAQDPADAVRTSVTWLRRLSPEPKLIEGKYSINALPPGLGGKGEAALALMNHLGRTGLFYIGDEDTDETVFSLPDGVTMGVRVGRQAESRARFFLHEQSEVEELLRLLVQCMA